MLTDKATHEVGRDAKLVVSMCQHQLVICVPEYLDLETTEALVVAAASGVAAGSTVMIDLDPATAVDELIALRPLNIVATGCGASDTGLVDVLGAGYVRLATRSGYWTIDMAHGRLCRSGDAIETHFIGPEAWTRVQALWVTPASLTVLTDDGTYLTTAAVWSRYHTHDVERITLEV